MNSLTKKDTAKIVRFNIEPDGSVVICSDGAYTSVECLKKEILPLIAVNTLAQVCEYLNVYIAAERSRFRTHYEEELLKKVIGNLVRDPQRIITPALESIEVKSTPDKN